MQRLITVIRNSFRVIIVLCFILAEVIVGFFQVPVLVAGIPLVTVTAFLILKYNILEKQYNESNENFNNKCNDTSANSCTD